VLPDARLLVAPLLLAAACAAQAACNVTMPNLSFGTYDPLSAAPATTSGNATVTCNEVPAPTVQMQLGPSSVSGGFIPRRMRNAASGDTLSYNFYADAGATQVWGDGTGGTVTRSQRVRFFQPWSVTFYGRIPVNQNVTPGSYTDTLMITIVF
jgi:spore coat protein U-like protein